MSLSKIWKKQALSAFVSMLSRSKNRILLYMYSKEYIIATANKTFALPTVHFSYLFAHWEDKSEHWDATSKLLTPLKRAIPTKDWLPLIFSHHSEICSCIWYIHQINCTIDLLIPQTCLIAAFILRRQCKLPYWLP